MTGSIDKELAAAETSARERRGHEAQADAVRARLARELDAIVNRKRRLLDPADELRRHPGEALVLAGTTAVLVAAGIGLVAYRRSTRKERARREKWGAWVPLVRHAERVSPEPGGFLLRTLERTASATLAAVVAAVAKHLVSRLMEAPRPASRQHRLRAERDPFPPSAG